MTPTFEHWRQWTAACALGLCPPEVRAALEGFVAARFLRYLHLYARRMTGGRPEALMPSPGEAWQMFETWLRLRHTRQGKTYKLWLLDHAVPGRPDAARLECAATLLVRDVVREFLRREFSPAFIVSLDRVARPDGASAGVSLHELIPDPAPARSAAERRDLERLAAREASQVMGSMPERERMALLARDLGLPLSHPDVVEAAGCGKSSLCAAYPDALRKIALHVRTRFPGEDRSTQADLAVRLLAALRAWLVAWGRMDPAAARLWRVAETEGCMPLSGAA